MNILTAIKLINWHYFTNETVRLSGNTLLTGDNGAGKSTVLDAVQYALVADSRKVRFNVSAHDETRRTLDGYLRGRTGTDTAEGAGQGCLRRGATVYATAEAYRADVLTKLGHLSGRFFDLLVKALAFRPITDVRRFVYDYLLDARAVQVDAMRDNMLQYRQFEFLAAQAREKVAHLEQIGARYDEKRKVEEWIAVQDYIIVRAEREAAGERLAAVEQEREGLEAEAGAARRRQVDLEEEERRLGRTRDELRAALHAHDAWRLMEDLRRQVEDLERQERGLLEKAERLAGMARAEAEHLAEAGRLAAARGDALGLAGMAEELQELRRGVELWQPLLAGDWGAPAPAERIEALAAALRRLEERARGRRFALEAERRRLEGERARLQEDLESLRRRRLIYDEPVLRLRERVAAAVGTEPRVLCEVPEIPDERWQDAVEGYLNTQRFDLLVPPEHFDAALAEYERRKREDRIFNVGLINTGRVLEFAGSALPGSLAEEVATEDPYARAYVDRLLGRVMKCETERELKRHPLAITPTCMTYRNHTARQIPFHVYENWFIGARALGRQRERNEARRPRRTTRTTRRSIASWWRASCRPTASASPAPARRRSRSSRSTSSTSCGSRSSRPRASSAA